MSFVLEISKKFKLNKSKLIKVVNNFKGLKYRQQVIYKKSNLVIINDSKSTSFSSSTAILKYRKNIYWLLGGIYKKGDKFNLEKKYFKNITDYIYGKNSNYFTKILNRKVTYKKFFDLENALQEIFKDIKKKYLEPKTILFSPSAASFDSFRNFEERGFYFNKLIKRHLNGKKSINL